mgnify:CR=1 FL=1
MKNKLYLEGGAWVFIAQTVASVSTSSDFGLYAQTCLIQAAILLGHYLLSNEATA